MSKKTNKLNINQLNTLVSLTNLFIVSGGESVEEQLNFIDATEKWVETIESYNKEVNQIMTDLKMEFNEQGEIIKGSKDKFEKALKPITAKTYDVEVPLSYVNFKNMVPNNFNIEQYRFCKKYLVD